MFLKVEYFILIASYCVLRLNAFLVPRSNVNKKISQPIDLSLRATSPGLFSPKNEDLAQEQYDLIVVGSGNGACGFLAHYLQQAKEDARILVLERGQNFFFTSDITHQYNWIKSYADGTIFWPHNAHTKDGRPILSGGACTMGGGGSINYTMLHEANSWLVKNFGRKKEYWKKLKQKLNEKFHRESPMKDETPITVHIINTAETLNYQEPSNDNVIENIPSMADDDAQLPQFYQFPTQFDTFGMRTHSGVSLVDWNDRRLSFVSLAMVEDLEFVASDGDAICKSVKVKFLDTKESMSFRLKQDKKEDIVGKVIMCSGAQTPRLLMKYSKLLRNTEIGNVVSDHIALPLGIYVKPKNITLSPKDIYGPVFVTIPVTLPGDTEATIVTIDFFTGKLERLLYMTSHLFLAFLLPNWLKNIAWTRPWLFDLIKVSVRNAVYVLNFLIDLFHFEFITAIIKFNPSIAGKYEDTSDNQITLGFFESEHDKKVAKKAIKENALPLLDGLGDKPAWIVRFLYRFFTKAPYSTLQIDAYLNNYMRNSLLSEQHLAGGCLLGSAVELGEDEPLKTGKVKGSQNVYVADLSASPLPRCSPQMTAYLLGYHVANELFPSKL